MHPRLQRGLLLIDQRRHAQADRELRQALAEDPNDALAHAALALCLVEAEQYADASQEVNTAIYLAPDNPFCYYVQAAVFHKRNRLAEAQQAIDQAIALAPYDADFHAVAGNLALDARNWQQALDAAQQGLACDPEHVDCNNIRGRALNQLGRPGAAQEIMANTLSNDPENATTHALLGWTLLEKSQYKEALVHFREALRLEPHSELARSGVIEALRAKRVLYRPILKYFLWIGKLQSGAQWGIIVGAWVLINVLRSAARGNPALAPWVTPIVVVYAVFAFSTWMAAPLFNLLLFLDPLGRLALSRSEKASAMWVGVCVLGALASLAMYFAIGLPWPLLAAVVFGLMIPPLSHIDSCPEGWPRLTMLVITVALLLVGATGVLLLYLAGAETTPQQQELGGRANGWATAFVLGAIGSQLAANWLINTRVRH